MKLAWWMWRQRIRYRFQLWWDLITMVLDIWVLLYLIVPALVFVIWYYLAWLKDIPAWFDPGFLPLVPPILGFIIVVGAPRTYLSRADLVYIYPQKVVFGILFAGGRVLSTLSASLLLMVFWVGIYPFYFHTFMIQPGDWLRWGLILLLIRWSVLQLKWKLRARVSSKIIYWLSTAGLWMAWTYGFKLSRGMPLPDHFYLLALGAVIIPAVLAWLIKVCRWESVVGDEEYQDLQLMRMFLGHAAQASLPSGRNGRARWWKGRWPIAFKVDNTLLYFFMKFLVRKRKMLGIYLQIYLLPVLIVIQNFSWEFRLLMLAMAVAAVGLLTELIWREHAEDLFLRMLPLTWNNCRQSVTRIIIIMSLPVCLVPLIMMSLHMIGWSAGILGLVSLIVLALVLAGYLGLKLAARLNYSYNSESTA